MCVAGECCVAEGEVRMLRLIKKEEGRKKLCIAGSALLRRGSKCAELLV